MVDKRDKSEDLDDEEEEADRGLLGEGIRKLLTAGLSAAFMTEEALRSYVSEMKLPKDALNTLLQGANKSKEQLVNKVGNEVINIISKIDFVKEASKFVEGHKFRISAEIEVLKRENGTKNEIKGKFKGASKSDKDDEIEEAIDEA